MKKSIALIFLVALFSFAVICSAQQPSRTQNTEKPDDETNKKLKAMVPDDFYEYFGNITRKQFPLASLALVDKPLFSFIAITDTHIGKKEDQHIYCHPVRIRELIRQINEFKPAFVLHCGDVITGFPGDVDYEAELDNALEVFEDLNSPIYYTAGNHDVGDKTSFMNPGTSHVHVSEEYIEEYEKRFGADYYSFDYNNSHFICLNSSVFNSGFPGEKEQWDWFQEDLKKAKDAKNIFMFFHYTLFWANTDDPGATNYESVDEPARSKLIDICKKYNIIVYQGHTHWDFHSYFDEIEYHSLYSTAFPRGFEDTDQTDWPEDARLFNPYKVGYYVVRVYPDKIITQLIQTYPKSGGIVQSQKENNNPSSRFVTRSSCEINDGLLGITAQLPSIHKTRTEDPKRGVTFERQYVLDQPIMLPRQIGIKWLKIGQPLLISKTSQQISPELERFITFGNPKCVKLIMPLLFEENTTEWDLPSQLKGKVTAWEILNHNKNDQRYSPENYTKFVKQATAVLKRTDSESKIILSELDISELDTVDSYIKAGVLGYADSMLFSVDISLVDIKAYSNLIKQIKSKVNNEHPSIKIYVSLKMPDETELNREVTKYYAHLLLLNQQLAVSTFIGSNNGNFSLIDNNLDATELYYVAMTFSAIFDSESTITEEASIVSLSSKQITKRLCRKRNGDLYLALWLLSEKTQNTRIQTDIIVKTKIKSAPLLIDPLTAGLQQLDYQNEGQDTIIPAVSITDYPLFIKIE